MSYQEGAHPDDGHAPADLEAVAAAAADLDNALARAGVCLSSRDVTRVNFSQRKIWGRQPCPWELPEGEVQRFGVALATYLAAAGRRGLADKVFAQLSALAAADEAAAPAAADKEEEAPVNAMTDEGKGKGKDAAGGAATRTFKERASAALKEGARRAPVELALEEGQRLLVAELLRGFRASRSERAAARKFLLWFMSTPAGQAAIAGAISAGASAVAGLLGRNGPAVQVVSDEFAARGATIMTKEGLRLVGRQLKPLLAIFSRLFDSAEAALAEGRPGAALGQGLGAAVSPAGAESKAFSLE